MFGTILLAACLAVHHAHGSELGKRDVTTITTWVPATTLTVNPSDYVFTIARGTTTEWHSTTTEVSSDSCTSYSVFDERPPVTVTAFVTTGSTPIVTRTDIAPRTRYTIDMAIVSQSADLTVLSIHCKNTLVIAYATSSTTTRTYTSYDSFTRVSATEVCMETVFPEPAESEFIQATTNPFASTTVATSTQYMVDTVWKTVETDTLSSTSTICNNPTVTTTSTYYTHTVTPVSMVTVVPESCKDKVSLPAASPTSSSASPNVTPTVAPRVVYDEGKIARRQTRVTAPELRTRTFSEIYMVGATETGTETTTWFSTLECPAATAAAGSRR